MSVNQLKQSLISKPIPTYSKGEERFNWISHAIGILMGFISLILLLTFSQGKGFNNVIITSFLFYSLSIILLYSMSTIYHMLNKDNPWKRLFRLIDHNTIYILILGTYAPVCALPLGGTPYGLSMFLTLASCAILGTVMNLINMNGKLTKVITVILYVVMGWCLVFFFPAISLIPATSFYLILAGGITYTIGVIFYAVGKHTKWMHSVFHVFVLLGTIIQFFGILLLLF